MVLCVPYGTHLTILMQNKGNSAQNRVRLSFGGGNRKLHYNIHNIQFKHIVASCIHISYVEYILLGLVSKNGYNVNKITCIKNGVSVLCGFCPKFTLAMFDGVDWDYLCLLLHICIIVPE